MSINTVERIDDAVPVRHVLVSVSDKTNLERLVAGLLKANPAVTLLSTGGTYDALLKLLGERQAAKSLRSVSDYTGQPEMQGGLVKTLDFKIYLGLLSETYNEAHRQDLARTGAMAIDLVVVNLYPFARTVAKPDATPEMARGNIDIGGPCMLRAAAKNYIRVGCVTDPADYGRIVDELGSAQGRLSLRTRFELARKAFAHVAEYDVAIARYLEALPFDKARAAYRIESAG